MMNKPKFDDLYKASPALAVADQLLGSNSPWRQPEEEPSLADQFIASTHTEALRFHGKARKMFQDVMMRYRLDMRKAHRFVLDDEFVDLATEMAAVQPAKILTRLQYATLPYEHTWIEFNLHAKMHAIHRLNGTTFKNADEVPQRLGCLLQRINDTDAVATLISPVDGRALPHSTCYFFSIKETAFAGSNRPDVFYGCTPMLIAPHDSADTIVVSPDNAVWQRASNEDSVGRASLWGYTTGGSSVVDDGKTFNVRAADMRTPEFLLRHGDIGLSRAFPPYASVIRDSAAMEKASEMIVMEMREFMGTMRWMVTVLAMLNEVPLHAEHVVREHQMRIGHFKKHQFVDYHKVTLRLPKTNPVPYIEKHLRGPSERRHRAHEVRAHWRTYLHEQHCTADEHDWVYDYDDGYRLCGKCNAYSRLIHEHVRGNQELGWVRKDYVIKREQG